MSRRKAAGKRRPARRRAVMAAASVPAVTVRELREMLPPRLDRTPLAESLAWLLGAGMLRVTFGIPQVRAGDRLLRLNLSENEFYWVRIAPPPWQPLADERRAYMAAAARALAADGDELAVGGVLLAYAAASTGIPDGKGGLRANSDAMEDFMLAPRGSLR